MSQRSDLRNPFIDALRGVAILLVMLLHFGLAYGFKLPLPEAVPSSWTREVMVSGNYGVSMFFVVSGFLITSRVLHRYGSLAAVDMKNFYLLRLFRLGPLLMLMLVVITVLWLAGLPKFDNIHDKQPMPAWFQWVAILSVLTFWHNVLIERVGSWFNYAMNICWSLSVEEVFYLAFPFLIRFVRARGLWLIALAFIAIGPAYRWWHRDDENYFLYGYLACFDQIAVGCVAAMIAARKAEWGRTVSPWGAAVCAVIIACIYLAGFNGHEAFGFTCLAVAVAGFLICVTGLDASRSARRRWSPLPWLGSRSYELYLFHLIVLGLLVGIWPRGSVDLDMKFPLMALFLLLSIAVAALVSRFVGNPLSRYLRGRYASRGDGATVRCHELAGPSVTEH